MAVAVFDEWVESRKNETVMEPAPTPSKHERAKVPRPKYQTMGELLAISDNERDIARGEESAGLDVDEAVARWHRDPQAFEAWLREISAE